MKSVDATRSSAHSPVASSSTRASPNARADGFGAYAAAFLTADGGIRKTLVTKKTEAAYPGTADALAVEAARCAANHFEGGSFFWQQFRRRIAALLLGLGGCASIPVAVPENAPTRSLPRSSCHRPARYSSTASTPRLLPSLEKNN